MRVAPHRAYRQFVRSCLLLNATARSRAACRALYAVSATPFAAPVQQVTPASAGGLLRVVLALIVVLAAVLVAAWLARRMRALSGSGGNANLEMLAQLPLGSRERAVLLRVGDCQVLIGVAPGSVRTLHVLQRASLPAADAATPHAVAQASDAVARPSFRALLLRSLGK
jgi:flagellar protein FliO/FliZ